MMNNKPVVVLCDLDGCLIDDRWRRHMCDWKNRQFEEYHRNMVNDRCALPFMVEILRRHHAAGHHIYFTTARPGKYYSETAEQLLKYTDFISLDSASILMRGDELEGVPSAELKKRMLEQIRKTFPKGTTFFAYDDHGDVCQMYKDMGVDFPYLVTHKIAVDCNTDMSSLICTKIRSGYSFQAIFNRTKEYNGFFFFLTPDPLNRINFGLCPVEQIFSELSSQGKTEYEFFTYEGDKSSEKRYTMVQKEMNVEHVSVDDVNRDEKERDEELLGEVKEQWLQPDVANLPRILEMSAKTFSDRRAIYGDSSEQYGRIMDILMEKSCFSPNNASEYEMMMFFSHVVGKLVRFSNSGMRHIDSIHDVINYAGLVECCVIGQDKKGR